MGANWIQQLPPGVEDALKRKKADKALQEAMAIFARGKKKTAVAPVEAPPEAPKARKKLTGADRRLAILQAYIDSDNPLTKSQQKEYDELKKKIKE